MKITKSELKSMIREALREELKTTSLTEAAGDTTTYVVYTDTAGSDVFEIFYVGTNLSSAKSLYKKELISYLGYGPDDSTSLRLIKANIPSSDVKVLNAAIGQDSPADAYDILRKLWKDPTHEEVLTHGGIDEFLEYVCDLYGCDFEDANNMLMGNDVLQTKLIKKYIRDNY